MPKGGSFETKLGAKRTVHVAGQEHDLVVQQISSSVWRAAGEFRERPLIAQGRTEVAAIANWEHIFQMRIDQ